MAAQVTTTAWLASTTPRINTTGPHSTESFIPCLERESGEIMQSRQTITFMPQHQAFSLEELRLSDYRHDRGKPRPAQPSANDPFQPSTIGLVPARLTPNSWPVRSARLPVNAVPSDFGSSIVSFDVGKGEQLKRFAIHENLIVHRSDFVRMALSKDWKESRERTIPLPDDEPAAFQLYHLWTYYNRIFSKDRTAVIQAEDTEYRLLTKAYILGEKLLDVHFKDAIADCMIETLRTTCMFDIRLTNLVYENTPGHSPLRKLLQDVYIWSGSHSWVDESLVGDFINAEFLLDVTKRHMMFIGGQRPDRVPFMQEITCGYHEHVGGVCYRGVFS